MKSTVYFIDLRATYKESLIAKIGRLINTAGLSDLIKKRDLVAVKLHFGERGNTAFIRPVFIRKIVEELNETGCSPFLTDSNTLYAGTRSSAPTHFTTAVQNGFAYSVINAPIIIADGLRGRSETPVLLKGKQFETVYIANEIVEADAMVAVAHFKGHEVAGFGGTLKNLGMGCASRKGKLAQHSGLSPKIIKKRCIGCGDCITHCSQEAISMIEEKADIDQEKCIGCGECIIVCPSGAAQVQWSQSGPAFMEKMIEYAAGALKNKKGKALFLNFITDISPGCDCMPYNDAPIVKNIGILASQDPVAIDRASVDLVNKEHLLPGSCIKEGNGAGLDKFRAVYPKVDWNLQLDYAEQLGLGTQGYVLEKI